MDSNLSPAGVAEGLIGNDINTGITDTVSAVANAGGETVSSSGDSVGGAVETGAKKIYTHIDHANGVVKIGDTERDAISYKLSDYPTNVIFGLAASRLVTVLTTATDRAATNERLKSGALFARQVVKPLPPLPLVQEGIVRAYAEETAGVAIAARKATGEKPSKAATEEIIAEHTLVANAAVRALDKARLKAAEILLHQKFAGRVVSFRDFFESAA